MREITVAGDSDRGLYFFDGELISGEQIFRQSQPMRLYIDDRRHPNLGFEFMTEARRRQTGDLGHHCERKFLLRLFFNESDNALDSYIHTLHLVVIFLPEAKREIQISERRAQNRLLLEKSSVACATILKRSRKRNKRKCQPGVNPFNRHPI